MNHKVNSPKINLDDSIGQAQTSFQIEPKRFQKVARELKTYIYIYIFSTE